MNTFLKCRFYSIVWLSLLFLSVTVNANTYTKATLSDEQFLLLDIKNKKFSFLEAIDAYGIDDQVLLPIGALLQSLELNYVVSVAQGTIKLSKGDVVIDIDLINQTVQGPLADIAEPILWSNEEDELLVSHLLIESMIDAKLDFSLATLAINISQAANLFPVERRLEREKRRQSIAKADPNSIPDKAQQRIFSDEFILDTYQLFTPPHANINMNLLSVNDGNDNSSTNTTLSNSIQSNFDLLYHYAQLTVNKQGDSDIASNLTFQRHQSSPYESFPLGIKSYSFGDVFGKADNLTLGNSAGIGFSVERRPVNYSRKFGRVTLEDMAPPGWEIELYRGGVLLQTSTVPDDGRYVFEDIETIYGVNKFEIKLYGPFGEEEVHHKNIRINSTQLKRDQFGFNSYVLDAGNKVLDGLNGQSDPIEPDTLGFAIDYGLTDSLTLGVNFSHLEDARQQKQQFVGTEIQTSIPGALLDFSFSHQLGKGIAGLAAVSGRLWDNTTYQLSYEKNDNYQTENANPDRDLITGSFSGRLYKVSYNNIASFSTDDITDTFSAINRLSSKIGDLNFTNILNFRKVKQKTLNALAESESFTGSLSVAGRLLENTRLSGSVTYDIKESGDIDQLRLSTNTRLTNSLNLNNQVEYFPDGASKWRVNSGVSWATRQATFNSSLSYDDNGQWSVSLGLRFSLGYDHHNSEWMMNAENMASSGTMDITSYLDQNNNRQLDEGDVALPGVSFSPAKQWQGVKSNAKGKAILPFISSFNPTTVNPAWVLGVSPSTRSYSVYTHPGSRIKAQVPFSVKTTVNGFVYLNNIDGDPMATANVLLQDMAGNTIEQNTSDEDGYFEFIDIHPGQYQIAIDPAALTTRTLRSDPGSLRFTTPPAGGYFELGVLLAVPISQQVSEVSRVIKPTIDNYEPIEEVEKLLGIQVFSPQGQDTTIAGPSQTDVSTIKPIDTFTQIGETPATIAGNMPKAPVAAQMLQSASVLSTPKAKPQPKPQLKRSSVRRVGQSSMPTTSSTSRFALQFAVFSTASLTNDLIKTLQAAGFKAQSYFDKQLMGYRVLMGPFDNQQQATNKSNELKGQGFDNFTRSWPQQTLPTNSNNGHSNNTNAATGLPANGFTIQLMVAQSQKSIDDTTANNMFGDDLFQIKKSSQGKLLNVLLKGRYLTRVQARQAVNGLPQQWRSKTWIRPVADLRASQVN